MRAMREARYNAMTAGTAPAQQPRRLSTPSTSTQACAPAPAAGTSALCGHRSMNGRTCTREQGHAAKSHRYS